jgi:hypothetical protein
MGIGLAQTACLAGRGKKDGLYFFLKSVCIVLFNAYLVLAGLGEKP